VVEHFRRSSVCLRIPTILNRFILRNDFCARFHLFPWHLLFIYRAIWILFIQKYVGSRSDFTWWRIGNTLEFLRISRWSRVSQKGQRRLSRSQCDINSWGFWKVFWSIDRRPFPDVLPPCALVFLASIIVFILSTSLPNVSDMFSRFLLHFQRDNDQISSFLTSSTIICSAPILE
jgi:hypothetical protein